MGSGLSGGFSVLGEGQLDHYTIFDVGKGLICVCLPIDTVVISLVWFSF